MGVNAKRCPQERQTHGLVVRVYGAWKITHALIYESRNHNAKDRRKDDGREQGNRPLRTSCIERYADIIKRGQWELNGETIKFDTSGTLLDGQHRLSAVILAGMPIKSYVIRDLPRKVFDTLDTGKGRTGADVLSLRGEKQNPRWPAPFACCWFTRNMVDFSATRKPHLLQREI